MEFLRISLILLTLASCGRGLEEKLKVKDARTELDSEISFFVPGSEGTDLNLGDNRGKTTLLVFASEFCSICRAEAKHMVSSLKDPKVAPNKVNVYHIMIGATKEDAQFWKEDFNIPWKVGYDLNGNLFKKLCKEDTTPCLVVHKNEEGVVFRHHGELSLSKLKKITGAWE